MPALRQLLQNHHGCNCCVTILSIRFVPATTALACQYKGKTMLQAHTGMNITVAEFNALVGDLVAALGFYDVPEVEKNDLLAILGRCKLTSLENN